MAKKKIFEKKNVLITGGAGFIGSHLCDELVGSCKVICVDNFSTGDEKNIDHLLADPDFAFIRHDISEPIDLEKFSELEKFKIKFQGIQEIYHLACPTSPMHFEKNKIATLKANSYGIKNMLDLAVKYKAKFMHFSSAVVYGPRSESKELGVKIKEDNIGHVDFLSERSSYDEGKRFAETMTINYRDVYKIDAKIVRIFRTYGPRMKLRDGQMLPDFVDSALDDKDLTILGDENFSSSFCYVSDVINAVTRVMSTDIQEPLNIGSDVDIKIVDVANKIIEMVESNSKITFADKILFMTPLCLPDITKIRSKIGWMPIVSLEVGLEKTIEDLRANKRLKRIKQIYE